MIKPPPAGVGHLLKLSTSCRSPSRVSQSSPQKERISARRNSRRLRSFFDGRLSPCPTSDPHPCHCFFIVALLLFFFLVLLPCSSSSSSCWCWCANRSVSQPLKQRTRAQQRRAHTFSRLLPAPALCSLPPSRGQQRTAVAQIDRTSIPLVEQRPSECGECD